MADAEDSRQEEEMDIDLTDASPPRRSPRKSTEGAEASRARLHKLQQELNDLAKLPWCGQAEKLGVTEKAIIAHYTHRIVMEPKLNGAERIDEPSIRYKSKYEPPHVKERSMSMKGLNPTRLGEAIIKSDYTPDEEKEKLARRMRSGVAKDYIASLETKRRRAEPESVSASELFEKRKSSKLDGSAQGKADSRKNTLDVYMARDAAMPKELFDLCLYYMAVFFVMCRIAFVVSMSRYFLRFLSALRPTFVKMLPSKIRDVLSESLLDEVYEEAKVITEEKLTQLPGRLTLGIDGHKMGKRHVETLTRAKLGISTFLSAELMGNNRVTGKHLAELTLKYLDDSFIAIVADNTGNNSGSRTGLFAILRNRMPRLICLGCCVHVLDLLIEDLAKIEPIADACGDAHFITSFVKKHAILYEEFLIAQKSLGIKMDLVLFPLTRFAYVHLMCFRASKNFSALRILSESSAFALVKENCRKRGKSGEKALAEFERFEDITGSRQARDKLSGVAVTLEPFSSILHYLEGDSTPISHVYPCYQLLYDYSQQLNDVAGVIHVLKDAADQDKVCGAVRERWLGAGRRVGLKDDLHLCAFALDPYVQAALTRPTQPESDLLTVEVCDAARNILKKLAGNDASMRSVLLEHFGLWCAAAPRVSGSSSSSDAVAGQSGHNAFSSLYLTGMQLIWDKVDALNSKQQEQQEASTSSTSMRSALKHSIANLKACRKPTDFWLAMKAEAPRGKEEREAHCLFCTVAMEILAIVSHTAGVERAGKGYGLVLTSLRKSLDATRAKKCVYALENYGLLEMTRECGDAYDAFQKDGEAAMERTENGFPRGSLLVHDMPDEASDGDETADSDYADEQDITSVVEWHQPEGFVIAPKPTAIDEACIGKLVFFNWEGFGWQLGKVTELLTSATPRLLKHFNVRIAWADGRGPTMLDLQAYQGNSEAPYDSWVFLDPVPADA